MTCWQLPTVKSTFRGNAHNLLAQVSALFDHILCGRAVHGLPQQAHMPITQLRVTMGDQQETAHHMLWCCSADCNMLTCRQVAFDLGATPELCMTYTSERAHVTVGQLDVRFAAGSLTLDVRGLSADAYKVGGLMKKCGCLQNCP